MLKRIFAYMKPYKKYTVAAVVCIILETVLELIIPFLMSLIIDVGVKNRDKNYIFLMGGMMLVCAAVSLILGVGSNRFAAVCGQGLGAELRAAQFKNIQSFSFKNIDKFRQSSLNTRLTADVTTIQNSVTTGLRPTFRAPVMMVTATILSFVFNAKLALVFLIAMPVLAVLLFLIVKNVRPLYNILQTSVDNVNRTVQENLIAIRVVKAYVKGDYEIEKFGSVNDKLYSVSKKAFSVSSLNMPAMQLILYTTIICILWFGGSLVGTGDLQVGELTGFLSYVLQVLNSLMMISGVFMMMTRSLASSKRILEVIDEKTDVTDDKGEDIAIENGSVEFRRVAFKYSQTAEEPTLCAIDLKIDSGKTVGIIGQTGAGKSSLVQLIPRLYDASEGEVLVDGRSVKAYKLKNLTDAVGMVLQKNVLFAGSIRDNIRWGKQKASDEEIWAALSAAKADEFVRKMPDGLSTLLEQGGANVSGGQKQRLCVARALIKRPKILILDDSTSAVDTATEAAIRDGLEAFLPGCTKIIIAQRIVSVQHTDFNVVLEEGRIRAIGTHEELLKNDEVYRELYHTQQEGAL